MEENNEQNRVSDNENKQSNGNKPRDFWKGLGLGVLLFVVGVVFSMSVYSLVFNILLFLTIIAYLGAIIACFFVGKSKFALGLIVALLIPVAIFGGCLLVVRSYL